MKALTAKAFASDGYLVQAGGRHSPEQAEYAMKVAAALESKHANALLEAETGTGKSLGYLIPCMMYLARHQNARIAVSTFTRALQKQLFSSDLPLAAKVVELAGLTPPKYAFRMGRQAFWSPMRVHQHVLTLLEGKHTPEQASAWQNLNRFAHASAATGTGLWMDYLDEYGSFPTGVSVQDVCLLESATPDNPAYTQHLTLASDAALLLTNHASLLINQRHKMLGEQFDAVIVDEAHEMEAACQTFTSLRTHPLEIARTLHSLELDSDPLQALNTVIQEADNGELIWTDARHGTRMDALKPAVQAALSAMAKGLANIREDWADAALTQAQATNLDALSVQTETLSAWLKGQEGVRQRAITFSPIHRIPAIASVSSTPGRIFGKTISDTTPRLIMTSATLADPSQQGTFKQITKSLGLAPATDTCRLYPHHYGTMRFVVSPKNAPRPVKDAEEETVLNPEWLSHCASMIESAIADGPTLVLCQSFAEAKALGKLVPALVVHQSGQSLHEVLTGFVNREYPAMITPSAWEGVSIRDSEGKQLIENLVITRLPFSPPNRLTDTLKTEYLLSRGLTMAQIKSIQWSARQHQVVIKTRQGLGRGIRHPHDEVTVWFADSRLPAFGAGSALLAAIPKRFLANYANATVFGQAKKPDLVMV